jgi:uncharacterized protein YbjT (DUF2867 family)/membrane protease YdiL (CAAX protease family)
MDKKGIVVVAGGTGFIGRHVTQELLLHNYEVVVLSRKGLAKTSESKPHKNLRHVSMDICQSIPNSQHKSLLSTLNQTRNVSIVNLVGIKREEGKETFEAAHIIALKNLITIAKESNAQHFVHMSVLCAREDANSPYHQTKFMSEAILKNSGVPYTILRPAVVYGKGDDMVSMLVAACRSSLVFPLVGNGSALHQPISVLDVAEAVLRTLEKPSISIGKTYELVGPEKLTMNQMVAITADGLSLPTVTLSTPAIVHLMAAKLGDKVGLPTPSEAQVRMLYEGMSGNPLPAASELGLHLRCFSPDVIRNLEVGVPPLFGISTRLLLNRDSYSWIEAQGAYITRTIGLVITGVILLTMLTILIPNIWHNMILFNLIMAPLTIFVMPLPWKDLFKTTPSLPIIGIVTAMILYMVGWAGFTVLTYIYPDFSQQKLDLYGILWGGLLPFRLSVLAMALIIVPAEEIIWRGAILLPIVGWCCGQRKNDKTPTSTRKPGGVYLGVALSSLCFMVAHLVVGPPLLWVACFVMGSIWSLIVLRTQSLIAGYFCHLMWDLAVMFVFPY